LLTFNLLWLALALVLGTPLIFTFGAKGFAYANIIVNIATIAVSLTARKYVNCKIFWEQIAGWLPAVFCAAVPLAFRYFGYTDKIYLILSIVSYYILSAMVTYFICRKDIKLMTKKIISKGTN
jgi:O-antigen/teichoic acid export membrane protein